MRITYESKPATRLSPADYDSYCVCAACEKNEYHTDFGERDDYCLSCLKQQARDEAESARQDAAFERAFGPTSSVLEDAR